MKIEKKSLINCNAIHNSLSLLLNSTEDILFNYFVFGEKKCIEVPVFINFNSCVNKEKILFIVSEFFKDYVSYLLKRELFLYKTKVGKSDIYFLSKEPMEIKEIISEEELGEIFEIPKCCIKKYIGESNGEGDSFIQSKRYIKQINSLNLKSDLFEVHTIEGMKYDTGGGKYEFIPCSPKCKKALRLKNKIDKIQRKILMENKII